MIVYRKKRWKMEGVFHLCLVGGVFRHQQDLTAAVSQRPDLLQDRLCFSGLGPADENVQHGVPPPVGLGFFAILPHPPPVEYPHFSPGANLPDSVPALRKKKAARRRLPPGRMGHSAGLATMNRQSLPPSSSVKESYMVKL